VFEEEEEEEDDDDGKNVIDNPYRLSNRFKFKNK
jgi:hypothetical protein